MPLFISVQGKFTWTVELLLTLNTAVAVPMAPGPVRLNAWVVPPLKLSVRLPRLYKKEGLAICQR